MRRHIIILTAATTFSSAVATAPAEAQTSSGALAPACERVVRTFVELDGAGAQLTADGRRKVTTLFAQPAAAASTDKVSVVEDDVLVSPMWIDSGGRMHVGTQYLYLGTLTVGEAPAYDNSKGRLKVRDEYDVSASRHAGASSTCKIEGAVPRPQLTLSAAIRHVTTLLGNARNDAERRRLTRTLNGLKREIPAAGTVR